MMPPKKPTAPPPPSAPSRREHKVPQTLVDFVSDHLTRGATKITLCHQTTAHPEIVDTWEGRQLKESGETIAARAWELAIDDARVSAQGAAIVYVLVVTRENGEGGRRGFRVPLTAIESEGVIAHKPNAEGVMAQAMAHLGTREAASQLIITEALDVITTGARQMREDSLRARAEDRETAKQMMSDYRELLVVQQAGARTALELTAKQLTTVTEAYNAQSLKLLEVIPVIEELQSEKHRRELETSKQQRSDERKDRLLSQASGLLFPVFAQKVQSLMSSAPPAPAKEHPRSEVAAGASAGGGTVSPPADAPAGSALQWTVFGASTLRALEKLFGSLDAERADKILMALPEDLQRMFVEVSVLLIQDHERVYEAQRKQANGVPNEQRP